MPGRDEIASQAIRLADKQIKLDELIAQDVRIRRASGLKLAEQILNDFLAIFLFKIQCHERNPEPGGDAHRIAPLLAPPALGKRLADSFCVRTARPARIPGPVLHECANDIIALFQ